VDEVSAMRGLALILAACVAGCSGCPVLAPQAQHATGGIPPEVAALRPRYQQALAKARRWLDVLHVDPNELRRVGIKGKKKLVEQLDAYYRLLRVASPAERPGLRARIRQVAAVTYLDRYHDMLTISERWFKQDATSYLRAAVLMERLGLDTRRYRQEIKKAHGRLNGHMGKRGPHQRRVFHWYYKHFGLEEPFPLGQALKGGVIARRVAPGKLDNTGVYDLTHEIYALYEYGDRLDVDPFGATAKQYLRRAFGVLVARYIRKRNPDLAAELVECMHYLRLQNEAAYRDGVRFLLETQNADGSWGEYERYRKRYGDYVRHGLLLHTTLVAIGALAAVFDQPMPPVRGQ